MDTVGDKVGIVAIGVGERLRHLLGLLTDRHGDRCELRALCDEAPAALAVARQALGPDLPHTTRPERLLEQLAGDESVPWVWIGSRNDRHRDHCLAAFDAGKHVFCEKPLATTLAHCREIAAAQARSGRRFATGFVLRNAPIYRRVRELVWAGAIGVPVALEANEHLGPDHGGYLMRNWRRHRELAGPYLLEKCCHDLDLLQWLLRTRARRVASFGGLSVFRAENAALAASLAGNDQPPLFRAWRAWEDVDPFTSDKDIVDHQVCLLEYESGTHGTFTTHTCAALTERRLLLHGLEGSVEADLVSGRLRHRRLGRRTETAEECFAADAGHLDADAASVAELVEAMCGGREPEAGLEAALESALVCFAIDRARLSGSVVELAALRAELAGGAAPAQPAPQLSDRTDC